MSVVKVTLTHSASRKLVPEKRYGLLETIGAIKDNAYTHFGTPVNQMRIELYDERDTRVESNAESNKPLGYFQCRDNWRVHVVDMQPEGKAVDFDDVSMVEKYEMPESEWLKRSDNLRAVKARMQEQRRAALEAAGEPLPEELNDDSYKALAETMKVGDRCACQPGDRLGTVRYIGRLAVLKPGFWVGVEFDEPVGKSDGSVKSVRVFTCVPRYGGFLRPDQVTVGDFPPEEF